MKSYKYYIFCTSIIKPPKKFTTIQLGHYNIEREYSCDKRSQFFSDFDWAKDVGDIDLRHEIEAKE